LPTLWIAVEPHIGLYLDKRNLRAKDDNQREKTVAGAPSSALLLKTGAYTNYVPLAWLHRVVSEIGINEMVRRRVA
jgi:hypothetical protein